MGVGNHSNHKKDTTNKQLMPNHASVLGLLLFCSNLKKCLMKEILHLNLVIKLIFKLTCRHSRGRNLLINLKLAW